jgi:hypothetical protein
MIRTAQLPVALVTTFASVFAGKGYSLHAIRHFGALAGDSVVMLLPACCFAWLTPASQGVGTKLGTNRRCGTKSTTPSTMRRWKLSPLFPRAENAALDPQP